MRYVLFVLICLAASSVEAGPLGIFGRRSNGHTTSAPSNLNCSSCNNAQPAEAVQGGTSTFDGSDQARCQQEANTMASRRIRGHVGSTIGRFEGVGSGGSPNCNTCTPEQYGFRGLSLSGDASARGGDGMWYRVRSWR